MVDGRRPSQGIAGVQEHFKCSDDAGVFVVNLAKAGIDAQQ